MKVRHHLNQILKPLTGYEIGKVQFGSDLWHDVKTVIGREAAVVLDVGANEGQSATQFFELFPSARIYSFEPSSGAFQTLAGVARQNTRLTAVNKALGEHPGTLVLHENKMHQTNSFLPAASRSKEYFNTDVLACEKKTEVEVTTLDTFCSKESIEHIDLLKVDVQGFELNVLKGARTMLAGTKIGCIVLEVSFVPLYENQ